MSRILIVDDEASILNMLRSVLEIASFEIEVAKSAADAKSRLSEQTFDIVLTDMRMETPTAGYEVIRIAKQLSPRPAIAILTAFPMSPADWRPSGADALLVKGQDILSLPDKLRALVKQRPQGESIANQRRSANWG
jgi:DNA-binding response OmpR family regulator